jgi:hypothetical protein
VLTLHPTETSDRAIAGGPVMSGRIRRTFTPPQIRVR